MSYKMALDIRNREKDSMFIIYTTHEPMGARYWSNEFGWVPKTDATRFTYAEMRTLNLPTGGYWVKDR